MLLPTRPIRLLCLVACLALVKLDEALHFKELPFEFDVGTKQLADLESAFVTCGKKQGSDCQETSRLRSLWKLSPELVMSTTTPLPGD